MFGMVIRYPPRVARSILRQSLQALAFLHEHGIAHGDLQPGNMLFCLGDDIDAEPEAALRQSEDEKTDSISPPVRRRDGKEDEWSPRYLCMAQSLTRFTPCVPGSKIKLSDLGAGKCTHFLVHDRPMT